MKSQGRIPSLDGLRAVSIFLVVIGHASGTFPSNIQNSTIGNLLSKLSIHSQTGVLTFFVISGYLITFLLRKEWEKTKTISIKSFYMRRVFRIFPAFYSYGLVIIVLSSIGILHLSWQKIFSSLTFSLNYNAVWDHAVVSKDYWFIGHFWTLSLEEQFYLLWPVTVLTFGLLKSKKVALSIILISPFIRLASYFLIPALRGQLGMMLHTGADSIMIGCFIALSEGGTRFEETIKRLSNGVIPALAFVFAFGISPILSSRFHGAYDITIGLTVKAISLALILIWVTRFPRTIVGRFLNFEPVVFIGILSYSLYLWQQLFLTSLNKTWTGTFPLNIAVAFAAALISHYLIEKPFLVLKNRLSERGHSTNLVGKAIM